MKIRAKKDKFMRIRYISKRLLKKVGVELCHFYAYNTCMVALAVSKLRNKGKIEDNFYFQVEVNPFCGVVYLHQKLRPRSISSTLTNDCVTEVHNQLIKVEDYENGVSKQTVTYAHDALGRRINKTIIDNLNNETETNYLYDGQEILAEYDDSSLLAVHTHSTLRTDDTLASDIKSTKLANNIGSYFYLKDSLGSIIDITDSSGNIVQHYVYSSFGEKLKTTDNSGNEIAPVVRTAYGFTNREHDHDTGLMHYRARVYMPEIGRFMQEDPYQGNLNDPLSFTSKYIAMYSNPLTFSDPNGEFGIIAALVISGLISGAISSAQSGNWSFDTFAQGFVQGFVGAALVAGGAYLAIYFAGAAIGTSAAIGYGALGGAIAGGLYGYALTGTVEGALLGAAGGATGGALYGVYGFGAISKDPGGAPIDATKASSGSLVPAKTPPQPTSPQVQPGPSINNPSPWNQTCYPKPDRGGFYCK